MAEEEDSSIASKYKAKYGSRNSRALRFFNTVSIADLSDEISSIGVSTINPKRRKVEKFKHNFECRLCAEILSSNSGKLYVLVSHIENRHPDVFSSVIDIGAKENRGRILKTEFLQCCAELIGVDGWPFSHLNSAAFLRLIQPKLSQLHSLGHNVDMKSSNLVEVKAYIQQVHEKIIVAIKSELKHTPISIMIDIASTRGRSILGISVQYLRRSEVRLINIGMCEMNVNHTSINIREVLWNSLKEFDIALDQIISITSDNAANMLAMSRIFEDISEVEEREADGNAEEIESDINLVDVVEETEQEDVYQDDDIIRVS